MTISQHQCAIKAREILEVIAMWGLELDDAKTIVDVMRSTLNVMAPDIWAKYNILTGTGLKPESAQERIERMVRKNNPINLAKKN